MSHHHAMRRATVGQPTVGGFNPETDITWHSLFWAEGTDFVAEGYSDTDPVDTWPNETGESDATQATGSRQPLYVASHASLNNQPAVDFDGTDDWLQTAAFSVNPDYTSGVSYIIIGKNDGRSATDAMIEGRVPASGRNNVGIGSTGLWSLYAGTIRAGNTYDTNPHMWRAFFDGSTGNDTLNVDESLLTVNADAGSEQIDGISIGAHPNPTNYFNGAFSLIGIYEGDISADGSWSDLKTWIDSHYGVTLP